MEKIPHAERLCAPKAILFTLFSSLGTPTNHGFIIVQQNTYIVKPYAMPAMTNNSADTRTDNRNVLLIEDEGEMCLLLNLILGQENLTIEHVKSLAEADAYLEKRLPALILLDNRLPDGFGLDYLGHLKKKFPWIKVILISGVDAAAADFALEIGADDFLSKPFTKAKLLASVNALLN